MAEKRTIVKQYRITKRVGVGESVDVMEFAILACARKDGHHRLRVVTIKVTVVIRREVKCKRASLVSIEAALD